MHRFKTRLRGFKSHQSVQRSRKSGFRAVYCSGCPPEPRAESAWPTPATLGLLRKTKVSVESKTLKAFHCFPRQGNIWKSVLHYSFMDDTTDCFHGTFFDLAKLDSFSRSEWKRKLHSPHAQPVLPRITTYQLNVFPFSSFTTSYLQSRCTFLYVCDLATTAKVSYSYSSMSELFYLANSSHRGILHQDVRWWLRLFNTIKVHIN